MPYDEPSWGDSHTTRKVPAEAATAGCRCAPVVYVLARNSEPSCAGADEAIPRRARAVTGTLANGRMQSSHTLAVPRTLTRSVGLDRASRPVDEVRHRRLLAERAYGGRNLPAVIPGVSEELGEHLLHRVLEAPAVHGLIRDGAREGRVVQLREVGGPRGLHHIDSSPQLVRRDRAREEVLLALGRVIGRRPPEARQPEPARER